MVTICRPGRAAPSSGARCHEASLGCQQGCVGGEPPSEDGSALRRTEVKAQISPWRAVGQPPVPASPRPESVMN